MHRQLLFALIATIAGTAVAPAQQPGVTAEPGSKQILRDRCHMDACSYFLVDRIELLTRKPSGMVFRVEGGIFTAAAPLDAEGAPDYERIQPPPEQAFTPAEEIVDCSTDTPGVAFFVKDTSEWYFTQINPGDADSVFGYNMSSHSHFWFVCLGENIPADLIYPEGSADVARRAGYSNVWPDGGGQETFASLDDLMAYLDRR